MVAAQLPVSSHRGRRAALRCLLSLLLGLSTLLPGRAQVPAGFVLRGWFRTLPEPARVYLLREGQPRTLLLDSAEVHDGRFRLRGTTDKPVGALLVLVPDGLRRPFPSQRPDSVLFRLENDTIYFSGADSLATADISNLTKPQDYAELLTVLDATAGDLLPLLRAATAPRAGTTPAHQRQLAAQAQPVLQQSQKRLEHYIRQHPHTLASLDALELLSSQQPSYSVLAPLFALLAPEVRASSRGRAYAATLRALPGAPRP